jgi:DNA primase
MYLDIEKIRTEITITMILDYYGIALRKSADDRLSGTCPLHGGDNPNAFHVDIKKNIYNCFTRCAAGGSIFDFVMKKENLSFYHAALKIYRTFYPRNPTSNCQNLKLKLRPSHPYLQKRNITPHIARFFQLGYCASGLMKDRIAIPICDMDGNTAAYCGRAIHDHVSPKYLFPKNFHKSQYLFNMQHIAPKSPTPVFIVEGFFDCIHIHHLDFDAIALMGTTISQTQISLLKQIARPYIFMLDGDPAGRQATAKIKHILKKQKLPAWFVYLEDGVEPESFSKEELALLATNLS